MSVIIKYFVLVMMTHIYVYNMHYMIISKICYKLIMVIFVICTVIIISCKCVFYCILNNVLIKYTVVIPMGISLFAL